MQAPARINKISIIDDARCCMGDCLRING